MSEYARFVPPGGSGARISGSDEEQARAGHASQEVRRRVAWKLHRALDERIRAFRATGAQRGTYLRK